MPWRPLRIVEIGTPRCPGALPGASPPGVFSRPAPSQREAQLVWHDFGSK